MRVARHADRPRLLYEDEAAESRCNLQTHNDRLPDTQHEPTCRYLTLSTVTRELGLSHDVRELERQDLLEGRKGRIVFHLLVLSFAEWKKETPSTPGISLHRYNVQFTYRQAAHSASTITVTCCHL